MEERRELAEARLRELIGELTGQKEDTNTEKPCRVTGGIFLWYRSGCCCSFVR